MSIEAMKQALEALEGLVDLAHEAGFPCDRAEAAITSLRQAIEQAEKQEPVAWMIWLHGPAGLLEHKQLAELEFERRNKEYPDENRKLLPLYTQPTNKESLTVQQAEKQEPVVTTYPMKLTCTKCGAVDEGTLTVEHPQREWKGLTRAECLQIEQDMRKYYDYQHECKTACLPEFARAIEAKLKEKNT